MSWVTLLPSGEPVSLQFPVGVSNAGSHNLDSSGDRAAFILQITKAGNLHKVRFRVGASTAGSGTVVRVSLQDLDASGDPDGTADQSATQAITGTDDDSSFQVTLDADRTVAVGNLVAVVIDYDTYVSGAVAIATGTSGTGESVLGLYAQSYSDFYNGASWTKSARWGTVILEYDDGTVAFQPGCVAMVGGNLAFNVDSTPDENGNIIEFQQTTRVVGAGVLLDPDAAVSVVLYDTDGTTALATAAVNTVARSSNATLPTNVVFASAVTCVAGSQYRLVLKPTTTTNITTAQSAFDAAASKDLGVQLGGADWHKTSRTGAGAWSENTLRRVAIWPIIDAIDVRDAHIISRQATLLRM